ncbi:MAG: MerR family transcriptional regulator [Promethearchaeota archaeon]
MVLSISQAAPILGVCSKTLRRWDGKDILCPDCCTPGRHRRYGLQTLEAFLQAGKNVILDIMLILLVYVEL